MVRIAFDVDGERQLSRNLRVAVRRLKDMQEFHKDAVGVMIERKDELFKNQGRTIAKNPKRKRLSPRTRKARNRRRGYYAQNPTTNPGILRWTGRLQNDIEERRNNNFGLMKFNAPYAPYHQKGGRRLPKRVLMDLDNATNEKIVKKLQEKIQRDIGIF